MEIVLQILFRQLDKNKHFSNEYYFADDWMEKKGGISSRKGQADAQKQGLRSVARVRKQRAISLASGPRQNDDTNDDCFRSC